MMFKGFYRTVYLFLLAQFGGLLLAEQLIVYRNPFVFALGEVITPADFLLFFLITTIVVIALQNIRHAHLLYRFLFYCSAFLGTLLVFASVFPASVSLPVAVLFVVGLILVPVVWVHDITVIVASIGIGAMIGGQLQWQYAALLLVALSVYDIVAVYVTKHMVGVANRMLQAQAIFALIIPMERSGFRRLVSTVQPGAGFLILGGGDVIFPLILSCSALTASIAAAQGALIGSTIGLMINNVIISKVRLPIPALPLIALGGIAGLLIGLQI